MIARFVPLLLLAALFAALFAGCGTTAPSAGRGLHWDYPAPRLEADGYPDSKKDLSSREWGVLFDDEGVTYGPRSYFIDQVQQEHPYLEVNEQFLQSRWVRVYESICCGPALLGSLPGDLPTWPSSI